MKITHFLIVLGLITTGTFTTSQWLINEPFIINHNLAFIPTIIFLLLASLTLSTLYRPTPRRLSTLLTICKQYHFAYIGQSGELGMCSAAMCAYRDKRITQSEMKRIRKFSSQLVTELSLPSHLQTVESRFLIFALNRFKGCSNTETVMLVWDAVIDKLCIDNK